MLRLDRLSTAELVTALDSPNGWQRDTAQRLLVHAQDASAVPLLRETAAEAARPLARLHALCTLDGLGALKPELVLAKLKDQHPGVRRHVVRLAEQRLGDSRANDAADDLGPAIAALASDPDAHVRMQVAYTLGEWQDPAAGDALAAIALADAGDLHLTTAVLSSLNAANIEPVLSAVLRSAPRTEAASGLLDRLLSQAAAIGENETLVSVLDVITTPRENGAYELWQLTATARLVESLARGRRSAWKLIESDKKSRERIGSQLQSVFDEARRLAAGDHANDGESERRLAAIELLSLHPQALEQIGMLAALLSPQQPAGVQSAAVAALGRIDDRHAKNAPVAAALLDAWKPLSPALRSQVLEVLLGRTHWTEHLLERVSEGAVAGSEIDAAHRQQLLAHRNERLRRRAEAVLASRIDADRQQVLEQYAGAATVSGDPQSGRKVFTRACATCHRLDGIGHEVGPDLAALTDKSPQALLVGILDPNRAVESKYVNYVAVTTDGRQHTGLLAAETGNSITLVAPENKRAELLRRDIEELTSTSKSTMPEGLEKDLSPQDVADVIAWLRSSVTGEPQPVSGSAPPATGGDGGCCEGKAQHP